MEPAKHMTHVYQRTHPLRCPMQVLDVEGWGPFVTPWMVQLDWVRAVAWRILMNLVIVSKFIESCLRASSPWKSNR